MSLQINTTVAALNAQRNLSVTNRELGGLASGIDTNSIIDQLMAVARRPIDLQESRKAAEQQRRIDAFGVLSTSLGSLLAKLAALKNVDSFRSRATTVLAKDADGNKVSATASTAAAIGSITFNVTQLATSTRAQSATPVGAAIDAGAPLDQAGFGAELQPGTFSINGTPFTIDAATATTIVSAASGGRASPGARRSRRVRRISRSAEGRSRSTACRSTSARRTTAWTTSSATSTTRRPV